MHSLTIHECKPPAPAETTEYRLGIFLASFQWLSFIPKTQTRKPFSFPTTFETRNQVFCCLRRRYYDAIIQTYAIGSLNNVRIFAKFNFHVGLLIHNCSSMLPLSVMESSKTEDSRTLRIFVIQTLHSMMGFHNFSWKILSSSWGQASYFLHLRVCFVFHLLASSVWKLYYTSTDYKKYICSR